MSDNPFLTLASQNTETVKPSPQGIIDLTVENQGIEISRPQISPIKIKNLVKKKVYFSSVSKPVNMSTSTSSGTATVQHETISLARARQVISNHETDLTSIQFFPLPSFLTQELLHDHSLTETEREKLEKQLDSVFFPFIEISQDEHIILFLDMFVSSKHLFGKKSP